MNTEPLSAGFRGIVYDSDLNSPFHITMRHISGVIIQNNQSWIEFSDNFVRSIGDHSTSDALELRFHYPDNDQASITIHADHEATFILPRFHKFAYYYLAVGGVLFFAPSSHELLHLLPMHIKQYLTTSSEHVQAAFYTEQTQPYFGFISPIREYVQNVRLSWRGQQIISKPAINRREEIARILPQLARVNSSLEWMRYFQEQLDSYIENKDQLIGVTLSGGVDSAVVALASLAVFPRVAIISLRTPENEQVLQHRYTRIQQYYPATLFLVEDVSPADILVNPSYLQADPPIFSEADFYFPADHKLAERAADKGVHTVLIGAGAEDLFSAKDTRIKPASGAPAQPAFNRNNEAASESFFNDRTARSLAWHQVAYLGTGIRTIAPLLSAHMYWASLVLPLELKKEKKLLKEILKQSIFEENNPSKDSFQITLETSWQMYQAYWRKQKNQGKHPVETSAFSHSDDALVTSEYEKSFLRYVLSK